MSLYPAQASLQDHQAASCRRSRLDGPVYSGAEATGLPSLLMFVYADPSRSLNIHQTGTESIRCLYAHVLVGCSSYNNILVQLIQSGKSVPSTPKNLLL